MVFRLHVLKINRYIFTVLKGRNAIVTGGSRGIGGSVALLLAKTGANVAIFGRNQKTLNDAVKLLPSMSFSLFSFYRDRQ